MAKLQFVSAVFKLHKPSARRRQILDHVPIEYTTALAELLKWSKANLDLIRAQGKYQRINNETGEVTAERYTEKSIAQILPLPSKIEADLASCLKEALVKNVASLLASYLALDAGDKQKAGFPVSRDPSPAAWPNALKELGQVGCDLEAENEARAKLMKISRGSVMPVHFCRSRDFAILTDSEHTRFFVWMKLVPVDSAFAQKVVYDDNNLINIGTQKRFQYRGRSGVLFPIQLGRRHNDWHWQYKKFIKPVSAGDGSIKTAKLVKDNGSYFLHVSIGFEIPQVYEPETYLGIDRGVLHSMAYGIVDQRGAIIKMGHSTDPFREIRIRAGKRIRNKQKRGLRINKRDYKQRELDGILHRLINDIVQLAIEHKAMIVLEDLSLRNVGRFYKSAYGKMYRFLDYKAAWHGVPIYKRRNGQGQVKPGVWAAYTSRICIHCGEEVVRDDRIVTCRSCGAIEHSDEAAGINIARRALYRATDWGGTKEQAEDWRAFHRSFADRASFIAKNDLRKEVVIR